ncbi:tRNA pseudouridine(38-40) synthase TruA [Marinobacteraceae bacterium S3BR75-40.1]
MLETPPTLTTSLEIGAGRVVLVIEYDGTRFKGWQDQHKPKVRTVQGQLQQAVEKVANQEVELVCAGRTDAGVHASYQVVHFDAEVTRPLRSWILGINTALPDDITVHWAGNAPADFHARFSATARRYRYVIFNHIVRPALYRFNVTWHHPPLDAALMHEAAQCLVGEHDFSAFRAAGCQSRSPFRYLSRIDVLREGPFVVIDVEANAFLHHMVRNIAGSLMAIGSGKEPVEWLEHALQSRDRRVAGITAPAAGLYLVDVRYPEEKSVPRPQVGPLMLTGWPTLQAD